MVVLNKANTSESIIVTLREKAVIASPFYLFVFENVATKEQIKVIFDNADNQSPFSRYDEFLINTSTIFATATAGQWNYRVYEQESSTNEDTTGLNEVECGKMELKKTNNFSYGGYENKASYTGYAG